MGDFSSESMLMHTGVFLNQAGYRPADGKVFVTNSHGCRFRVVSMDGSVVLDEGEVIRRDVRDEATGMRLAYGDFSSVTRHGGYRIEMDDGTQSVAFRIADEVYGEVAEKALRSFYYQRCGVALDRAWIGDYCRPACHIGDAGYHASTGRAGELACSGGWHDAGDYGKYVHATAVAVGIMLQMYEQYPECFASDRTGIPESGNGIPDFLDEMRVALDWMLTMQVTPSGSPLDGGVHVMVNSKDYTWLAPDKDIGNRWVYGVSSVATADFAAAMALACRVFRTIEGLDERSGRYLAAALAAWSFLERHPSVFPEGGYVRPEDTRTGGYLDRPDDQDMDDRLWAAVELSISTGESMYMSDSRLRDSALLRKSFFEAESFRGTLEWGDVSAFAFVQSALHPVPGLSESRRAGFRRMLVERCESMLARGQSDGFGVILDQYRWGSNGSVLGLAQLLLLGEKLVDAPGAFRKVALDQLHYVLGRNALGMSFVTGIGERSPRFLHHASIANDGIDAPFPGLLAGGPNADLGGDQILPLHFNADTPPALCYLDHVDSWASNENCILYNAPLVSVAHVLAAIVP